MKYFFYLLFILFSLPSFAFVILIDPGHGGDELGAVGKSWVKNHKSAHMHNIYEKDLALKLAKKIKSNLDKKFTVYLTRSIDRKVSLEERTSMADAVKADLFISVHLNSSVESDSNGFETYYLDGHKDIVMNKIESVENEAFGPVGDVVNQILIDLVIDRTARQSRKLAESVHENIKTNIGGSFKVKDRGIRSGVFYVLALSKRPGVLLEAGFMSNPSELKKMRSSNFLSQYAKGVSTGIEEYLATLPPKDLSLF